MTIIAALLVAAGTGSRYGAPTPKQFLEIAGRPVIRHAAEALIRHGLTLQPVGDAAAIDVALAGLAHRPTIPGGATRQDSVRAGLEALADLAPDIVMVHDAARPIIPPGTVEALIAALATHPGAIPAIAVADTIKRGAHGLITEPSRAKASTAPRPPRPSPTPSCGTSIEPPPPAPPTTPASLRPPATPSPSSPATTTTSSSPGPRTWPASKGSSRP